MDNAVSEDDDEHKLLNEDELVSFQKNLLKDDNLDVVEEPIINEEPLEKYDLKLIEQWIKTNIED